MPKPRRQCPPAHQIFRAFNLTPPDKTKVAIVGQDPYHTPGMANGLAFSINEDCATPPSLRNIYQELSDDLELPKPQTKDLTPWAEQGVLLMNNVLTVVEHQPNSCVKWGWQKFTGAVLSAVADLPQPVVFILWGAFAQDLSPSIIRSSCLKREGIIIQPSIKKSIIMSSHPSPLSARKPCRDTPAFLGSKPFSKTNMILEEFGSSPIDWKLN